MDSGTAGTSDAAGIVVEPSGLAFSGVELGEATCSEPVPSVRTSVVGETVSEGSVVSFEFLVIALGDGGFGSQPTEVSKPMAKQPLKPNRAIQLFRDVPRWGHEHDWAIESTEEVIADREILEDIRVRRG